MLNKKFSATEFAAYLHAFDLEYVEYLIAEIKQLGLQFTNQAQLQYCDSFKPLPITYEIIFVRHGETYGNCGQATADCLVDHQLVKQGIKDHNKRIFQGCVDHEINQLTITGQQQAQDVANRLTTILSKGWQPNYVLHSPLTRARDTAIPFIQQHNLEAILRSEDLLTEMSFGAWDNRRVCDFDPEHDCHTFYKFQNALIKKSGINGNHVFQHAECFAEVLLRAKKILLNLNDRFLNKKIIIFSHSMFGAACAILLGRGVTVQGQNYLAFDGKVGNANYCMPHATPIPLNFSLDLLQH